jgi:catechol 2,3-dioxygenase-like lactoylglutathione lyase family enzyme
MTVHAFSHIALRVTDLARSLRFYRDGLGFREVSRIEVEGGPTALLLDAPDAALSAIFLERDGTTLELQTLSLPDGRELPDRAKSLVNSGALPPCYLAGYAETQLEITMPAECPVERSDETWLR